MQLTTTTTERPGVPTTAGHHEAGDAAPRGAVLSQHVTSEGLVTYTRGRDGRVQIWVERTPQRRALR